MAISRQYTEKALPYVLAVSPTADMDWRLFDLPQSKAEEAVSNAFTQKEIVEMKGKKVEKLKPKIKK